MVKGLDLFAQRFERYRNSYVLIGGTACSLAMEEAGQEFRSTKDLDIVLLVEALDSAFFNVFWDFIRDGGYGLGQRSTGTPRFYRFSEPRDSAFPYMLELFSVSPLGMEAKEGVRLTPLPSNSEASSLSAILLDEDYYAYVQSQRREYGALSALSAEGLLILKAKAWLELSARKDAHEAVDSHNIKKHAKDIVKLARIIQPGQVSALSGRLAEDLDNFLLKASKVEQGIRDVAGYLRNAYGMEKK